MLQQSLALFDCYTRQITACDAEIARTYSAIRPDWETPAALPEITPKPRSQSENQPQGLPVREHLYRIRCAQSSYKRFRSLHGPSALTAHVHR